MGKEQKNYSRSYGRLEGICFAIKFYHKLLDYTDLCAPFVVSSFLEATKKLSLHNIA